MILKIVTILVILFFYTILKKASFAITEMIETLFKLRKKEGEIPYLIGELIAIVLFFVFDIFVLIYLSHEIIDLFRHWK